MTFHLKKKKKSSLIWKTSPILVNWNSLWLTTFLLAIIYRFYSIVLSFLYITLVFLKVLYTKKWHGHWRNRKCCSKRNSWRILSNQHFVILNSIGLGLCRKHTSKTNYKCIDKLRLWRCPVKVQTIMWLRCCDMTLTKLFILIFP